MSYVLLEAIKWMRLIILAGLSAILLVLMLPSAFMRRFQDGRKTRRLRILVAGTETSSNIASMARLLAEQAEYLVSVCQFQEHPFYPRTTVARAITWGAWIGKLDDGYISKEVKAALRTLYTFRVLHSIDVIVFNWHESFLPMNLDYALYRLARLKCFVRHCGDDVRYRPLQHGIHSTFGVNQWAGARRSFLGCMQRAWRQRVAEALTEVMSTRDHATFQGRSLFVRPYVQFPMVRTSGHRRLRPLLLHAPSDVKVKGTSQVCEAIAALRSKGFDFEFEMLHGVDHSKVVSRLGEAAIVIDQPGAVPARLAVEAMATGCVVIGGNVSEVHLEQPCPVLQFPATAEELGELLASLLSDRDRCERLGAAGAHYWCQHCSPEAFLTFFSLLLRNEAPRLERHAAHGEMLRAAALTWYERALVALLYPKAIDSPR